MRLCEESQQDRLIKDTEKFLLTGETHYNPTMSKNIPIGIDDFGNLINPRRNYQFVDKSLFIKEIIDDASQVTLITRPRRWGKTLNLSMLEHFLAPQVLEKSTSGIFDTLAIAKVDNGEYLRYQGQYPVIFISFKDVQETQFSSAVRKMRALLSTTFRRHKPYLLSKGLLNEDDQWILDQYVKGAVDQETLADGLLILSEFLYRGLQSQKVYILVDEYDTPVNHAYQHGYLNEMTGFMKNLLSAAFKGNPYLEKGVMTGVLRISKDSMLSGLNNVEVHSVLNTTYATHFGFSDAEVSTLFAKSGLQYDMGAISQYYNGYRIGTQACYNPWSIMQCLKNGGSLQPYWVNTADDSLLKDIFLQSTAEVTTQLQTLIGGAQHCIQHTVDTTISDTVRFEDIVHDETALWSLLLSTGYLTVINRGPEASSEYRLAIPNQEVQRLYVSIFKGRLLKQLTKPLYKLFMEDLVSGRIEVFTQKLEQYLMTHGSYHDFRSESNYHTFMLGLLCGLTENYYLYSNVEAGQGRADMILVPHNVNEQYAIVMEFKRDTEIEPSEKSAQEAIDQIDTRQYQAFIARYATIQRILKIGLVFNGKQVASRYCWSDF